MDKKRDISVLGIWY